MCCVYLRISLWSALVLIELTNTSDCFCSCWPASASGDPAKSHWSDWGVVWEVVGSGQGGCPEALAALCLALPLPQTLSTSKGT